MLRSTMRAKGAVTLTAMVVAAVSLVACTSESPVPATAAGGEALALDLARITNEQRAEAGLAPLEWSDCLASRAVERAQPFVEDADLAHEVLVATCTANAAAAENLSRSDRAASQVVEAWLGSPGHRANLLSPDMVTTGIACLPGPAAEPAVYSCAQLFEGRAG